MIKIGKTVHNENENIDRACIIFYADKNRIFYTLTPSGDFYFSIYFKKETIMYINKFDDYKLYMAADKLYNSIKSINSEATNRKVSIKSDIATEEIAFTYDYIFNYLDIYKSLDTYIFKFVNNSENHYEFCISSDNKEYSQIFKEFLNDINLIDDQITIDEYLYKQKILEKRK